MRAGARYDCGRCARHDIPASELCAGWCADARDEHDNARPLPASETVDRLVRGHPRSFVLLELPHLFGPAFTELALGVRQIRSRRRLKARLAACGRDAAPIAEVTDGPARVEGRVRVLAPATSAAGREDVAAFVWRNVTDVADAGVTIRRVVTRRGRGRFVVEDDTGLALIDDDFVELRDFGGHEPEPAEAGGIVVKDGALVTVLGRARRGAVELPTELRRASGYRGLAETLILEGSSAEPLVIFAEPSGPDAP